MAAYLQSSSQTLAGQLNFLYKQYGYHYTSNSYFICHEPETIASIFQRIRSINGASNTVSNQMPPNEINIITKCNSIICPPFFKYPNAVLNGKYPVVSVRDLTTGYDSCQPDKKSILPASKSTQMVTFSFENGAVITLRTSGTEPKLKYYAEMCASPQETYVSSQLFTTKKKYKALNKILFPLVFQKLEQFT